MKYKLTAYNFNNKGTLTSVFEQLMDTLADAERIFDTIKDAFSNYEVVDNETGETVKTNFRKKK